MNLESVFQWSLSIQGITMLWLMGNASKWGPMVGMFGQVLWITYAIITAQWGLLPGIAGFTLVHIRNCWKMWNK